MAPGSENPITDLGKTRGIQQVTTTDGLFLTCALDHGDDYRELIDPDLSKVSFEQTVASKLHLMSALSGHVSSFLLDPEYAAAHSILSGTLPRDVGLMVCVEAEGGYAGTGSRGETQFRTKWNPSKIKRMGANMCKLLWYFRPDSPVHETQRQIVRDLSAECAKVSLPLVVEPIWNALDGEDTGDAAWQERRFDGIVESAIIANGLGTDVLKLEFPGSVNTDEGRNAAAKRCERITEAVDVPWVILSAGVDYSAFKSQVEIACKAGASGFMAGRSIWRDAVPSGAVQSDRDGAARASSRLAELADITVKYGTPCRASVADQDVAKQLDKYWYHDSH